MSTEHRVAQGDCLESIAVRYGFLPRTLWDAPENGALRAQRSEPHALAPGDTVVIPELRLREEPAATGQRHRFKRKGVPAVLRLQLLSCGKPRVGVAYTLTVDGRVLGGVTNGEGWIVQWIPPAASTGELRIGKREVYQIRLGYVDPVESPRGLRSRLVNLAYLADAAASEDDLAVAIARLRADHGLPEGEEIDDATRRKIVELHRS